MFERNIYGNMFNQLERNPNKVNKDTIPTQMTPQTTQVSSKENQVLLNREARTGGVPAAVPMDIPATQRGGLLEVGAPAPQAEAAAPSRGILTDVGPASQARVKPQASTAWQMEQLLKEGSPYLEAARQGGLRTAAQRGLLQSSIAAHAGERAAIEAAFPIAQATAQTYGQYGLANLQTQAALQRQVLQSGTQMSLAELQAETQTRIANQAAALDVMKTQAQLSIADLDAATKMMGIQMDNESKMQLQTLIEDNKRVLQTDASISTAFSNTMNSIAQMYQNPEMNWYQQREAAKYFMDSFRHYVEFQDVMGGSNYAKQFNWGAWDKGDKAGGKGTVAGGAYSPVGRRGRRDGERKTVGGTKYRWNEKADRWELHDDIPTYASMGGPFTGADYGRFSS